MKILQVVHGFPQESIAGTEVYTYNLARELAKKHDVFVFYRTADFSKKEYELSFKKSEGLNLFSINNTFREYSSFESTYKDEKVAEKFAEVLERTQPDIVHVQHLLYLSAKIIREAKKRDIPVIFTLNDYWLLCPQGQLLRDNASVCNGRPSRRCIDCVLYQLGIQKNVSGAYAFIKKHSPEWCFQMMKVLYLAYAKLTYLTSAKTENFLRERIDFMREICSEVDLFIAPSEFLREKFIEFGVSGAKIEFLPYGFDLKQFEKRSKTPSSILRFGFIGNLMPAKGAHVLVKSFNALPLGVAELRIYGKAFSYKSALGNYVGQLKSLAKGNPVQFMGEFDHSEIGRVLSEIDVLVVPSLWYENAPLVIQEALLSRTPVIASRIGGIPELITDGVNGILFEPGSEQELKEKMEFLIRYPSLLNRFKREALEVRTIEGHAKEIEILYEKVGSRGSLQGDRRPSLEGPLVRRSSKIIRDLWTRSMTFIQNSFFVALFFWMSFIPLPLQCRYPFQLKIFFWAGLIFLCIKNGRQAFKAGDWPLWLFLTAMSFGVCGVVDRNVAVATFWDLSMPMIFIYYLIANGFSSKEGFALLARVICVFSTVVALWGLLELVFRFDFLYEGFLQNPFYDTYKREGTMRAMATQFHAPPLGTYLIASLPFSLLVMKQERTIYRILGRVGVLMAVTVSILTFSRGVFLSLAAMLIGIRFFQNRKKTSWFLLAGIAAFVFLASYFRYPFEKFSFNSMFLAGDGVFTPYRFERVQMLGNILKEHPFFGIGFQHVRLLFHNYYPGRSITLYDFRIMDNMYLTIAAETGLVGITAFLVFIGSMILKGWRGLEKATSDEALKIRSFYVLIGFLGLLVNAAAYELFYWPSPYMFFCIYIGLIEAFFRRETDPPGSPY